MHILFITNKYPTMGGVEVVTTQLANKFIEDGNEVTIASFIRENADLGLSSQCHLLEMNHPINSKANILNLHNYILENRVDFIINQWIVPFKHTYTWSQAVKGTNCKVISCHHNQPNTNSLIQGIKMKIEVGKWWLKPLLWVVEEVSRQSLKYGFKKSDKFVVLSPSFIPVAKKFMRVSNDDKFFALENPITIKTPQTLVPFSQKKKNIICVGRIMYNQKRTFRVVDIWKKIESKYPDWNLIFVGDGPDKIDLEKRIAEADLKRVQITGFTNPIPYYKDASILILTSEYEGFGLVIIEGMSYGVVPIVYGSYEAVFDIIENGETGFVTSTPFQEDQMVARIEELINDETKLSVFSNSVQEKARHFHLNQIIKKWYNLFESLK